MIQMKHKPQPFYSGLLSKWVLTILADPEQKNIVGVEVIDKIGIGKSFWIYLTSPIPTLEVLENAYTEWDMMGEHGL